MGIVKLSKINLPLALVSNEGGDYVTAAAGRGFSVLLHVGVTPLAHRRCGAFAASDSDKDKAKTVVSRVRVVVHRNSRN